MTKKVLDFINFPVNYIQRVPLNSTNAKACPRIFPKNWSSRDILCSREKNPRWKYEIFFATLDFETVFPLYVSKVYFKLIFSKHYFSRQYGNLKSQKIHICLPFLTKKPKSVSSTVEKRVMIAIWVIIVKVSRETKVEKLNIIF